VRGLLVVSEWEGVGKGGRLQVLTPKGVPLQVPRIGSGLGLAGISVSADEARVWVTGLQCSRVHALNVKH
jgi:hypothetical protein